MELAQNVRFYIAVLLLCSVLAAVFIISRIKKVSLFRAAAIFWGWLLENLGIVKNQEPPLLFILQPVEFEKLVQIVVKHSRLDFDSTSFQTAGSVLCVQLLPRDDGSSDRAQAEGKVFLHNIARVYGVDADIESEDEPGEFGTRILWFHIAVTPEHKAHIADLRRRRSSLGILAVTNTAGTAGKPTAPLWPVLLGRDAEYGNNISADFDKTGHLCLVGGTGSGKSFAALSILANLLTLPISAELFICDFKKSGDFAGITENFAEFDAVPGMIEKFWQVFNDTPEGYPGLKLLVIDEYAGFMIWLAQQDKKLGEEIKTKISSLLMLGRSRHCFVWCIQQRMSAALFPSGIGAVDNFQICIGFGRLSPDSRKSLFAGEWPEEDDFIKSFSPSTGQGLVLIDGQPVRPFLIPDGDKKALQNLCRNRASATRGGAAAGGSSWRGHRDTTTPSGNQ